MTSNPWMVRSLRAKGDRRLELFHAQAMVATEWKSTGMVQRHADACHFHQGDGLGGGFRSARFASGSEWGYGVGTSNGEWSAHVGDGSGHPNY